VPLGDAAGQRHKINQQHREKARQWNARQCVAQRSHREQIKKNSKNQQRRAQRAARKIQLRLDFAAGGLRSFWGDRFRKGKSGAEDLVDFFRQLKIVVADAFHAVRIQVDDHFVPHVEPFG